MASPKLSKSSDVSLSASDQDQAITYLVEHSIETIVHDVLLDIHQDEKIARMQTAVPEVEQKAEKPKIAQDGEATVKTENEAAQTDAAMLKTGEVQLK
ncbi:hypothetical protein AYL99_11676 [Fonsecaea erecta]|uniref:Uncharacterized protein n=1 Tax=Fonsecaea erecta TaxID=1367422 RepID=A0A178Z3M1_9EURO|nr:hypothetical protein AYL99_11676 [Fonsecaea erecta]OAP54141.1 hypothetical protein AYL99_11676 [Fonsecaea erecta]